MPKIQYVYKKFNKISKLRIQQAESIINDMEDQGFDLTLRQLYYQFVTTGEDNMERLDFPEIEGTHNNEKSYKQLGTLINNARLAGLLDWENITDRTRNIHKLSYWDSPADIIQTCASQYRIDLWKTQYYRPEIWIEKDALLGVFEQICNKYNIPYFSCRGYNSQSAMWRAGQRSEYYFQNNQQPIIFHFGDHDPSGIDMTRDIQNRFDLFCDSGIVEVKRVALNMDQIKKLNPPPNPTKPTDSRAKKYVKQYGYSSWELDALKPNYIVNIIKQCFSGIIDSYSWDKALNKQLEEKKQIQKIADEF